MSRTYSQDEVREIIRRATEATAERERRESEDSGLSMDDLADLATSAGIDPDVMLQAARSLDREVHEPFEKRMLGVKISAAHAIRVEGPFSEEDWLALVADCRSTFEAKGTVQSTAGLREWSNGNLHVLVEPAGSTTIIRMRTHHGAAQRMAGAGAAMSIAAIAMMISAFSDGRPLGDVFSNMIWIVAALFAAGGLMVTRIRNWSRTRSAQMEAIGQRIEARRPKREEAPLLSTPLQEAEDFSVDLLADVEPDDAESARVRRRERE